MRAPDEKGMWHLETKLLTLLHVDSTGSPTWFLDACGQTTHRKRCLLLTNHDVGIEIPVRMLQLGLNFGDAMPELFAGKEIGQRMAHGECEDVVDVASDVGIKNDARLFGQERSAQREREEEEQSAHSASL